MAVLSVAHRARQGSGGAARWLAVTAATGVALAAAGCGNGDGNGMTQPKPGPPMASTPMAGSTGFAVSRSDVAGLSDSALTTGSVLFFPWERTADVAAAAQAPQPDPYTSFSLQVEQLAQLGGVVAAIGRDGRFPVPVDSGSYLVCLADSFADHSAGSPHAVVGCAKTDLTGGTLTVAHGEGGVEATLS